MELRHAHTAQQAYLQKLQESSKQVSKYKRTIQQQEQVIQRLEAFFRKAPHGNDKQRLPVQDIGKSAAPSPVGEAKLKSALNIAPTVNKSVKNLSAEQTQLQQVQQQLQQLQEQQQLQQLQQQLQQAQQQQAQQQQTQQQQAQKQQTQKQQSFAAPTDYAAQDAAIRAAVDQAKNKVEAETNMYIRTLVEENNMLKNKLMKLETKISVSYFYVCLCSAKHSY